MNDADETNTVQLAGNGLLYDVLSSRLELLTAAVQKGHRVVVAASDAGLEEPPNVEGVWWLPVRTEHFQVVVGPRVRRDVPGCIVCLSLRRARARTEEVDALWNEHGVELRTEPSPHLTRLAAEIILALVMHELSRLGQRPGPPTYRRLALDTLTVTRHSFLPDPLCPACGDLPLDRPEDAVLALRPRPERLPGTYRIRSATQLHDALLDTYVDSDAGLVSHVERGDEAGFAVAKAPMRLRTVGASAVVESGWGRSDDYRTSEVVALLEALERWGGMQPGGKRTAVRAPYSEVAGQAIDPRSFGLPETAGTDDSRSFKRFDPGVVCNWVWAYSFGRRRPVLVPEGHAYYGIRLSDPQEPRFADEISNGCAVGSCLEEAILYGLLETAERDAFLTTWYTRFSRRRIDLTDNRDAGHTELVRRIQRSTGYDVLLFDTTMEYGIPSVWAMAVHPEPRPSDAKVSCSAAAHLDPRLAVAAALTELGPVLASVRRSFPQHRVRVETMVTDPAQVRRMADHPLLYAHPEVFDRFDFLLGDVPAVRLAEMAPGYRPRSDLRDDLLDAIGRFLDRGLDVVVVDQTTAEHRATGLSCVKVLIPGTVPMSFGHANRRTTGLPRLFTVPAALGHPSAPSTAGELNPYPHPFA